MKKQLQKIHDARADRAKNNLKEMFNIKRKYGIIYTKKETQLIKDIYPGIYKIYKESKKHE